MIIAMAKLMRGFLLMRNVQVIMEKFGGGGHLTTAAAQVDSSIDETVEKIMNVLEANKQ